MSKPKLTPWFPASIKPVRPGHYEIQFADGSGNGDTRVWTGTRWVWASGMKTLFNTERRGRWRGLAEQPK